MVPEGKSNLGFRRWKAWLPKLFTDKLRLFERHLPTSTLWHSRIFIFWWTIAITAGQKRKFKQKNSPSGCRYLVRLCAVGLAQRGSFPSNDARCVATLVKSRLHRDFRSLPCCAPQARATVYRQWPPVRGRSTTYRGRASLAAFHLTLRYRGESR
jgi:hypothetical protein